MKIGILGTGFGAYHTQLWQKSGLAESIIVFGRNEGKLQHLQSEYKVDVTTRIDDILQDPEVSLIDICLPTTLHREYTIQALKHGKHVFCETPLCLTEEDLLAMQQAEQTYGRRVFVNQFIKFDPPYTYLHNVISGQKYGKLLSLTLKRETPPLWGDLGLKLIATNLMIHELDFISGIRGPHNPAMVWGTNAEKQGQALVRVTLQHPEGLTEVMASSQMPEKYPFMVGYEAYFEHGKLVYNENDYGTGPAECTLLEYTSQGRQQIHLEGADPYEKSIEHVAHALQHGTDSCLSIAHAAVSLETAFTIRQTLMKHENLEF
ncbi:Gfo/Idh/MocA family protein [Paenibacillus sp. GCM10012306]|uniref:Gfo/Idh/MocA family protein n=1 Tax=Paenibacillus sp. GCM10012306 TaxID=3317342 RepID=UPI003610EC93